MDLQLGNKVRKRRVKAKLRADRTEPTHSNHVWAVDFVHNQLATGRNIRVLTVVDTFSRFSPAVDIRFSYKGEEAGCRRLSGYAGKSDIQRRSVSKTAANSSRATST